MKEEAVDNESSSSEEIEAVEKGTVNFESDVKSTSKTQSNVQKKKETTVPTVEKKKMKEEAVDNESSGSEEIEDVEKGIVNFKRDVKRIVRAYKDDGEIKWDVINFLDEHEKEIQSIWTYVRVAIFCDDGTIALKPLEDWVGT